MAKISNKVGYVVRRRGYDDAYFRALISEAKVPHKVKGRIVYQWEVVAKDKRNEAYLEMLPHIPAGYNFDYASPDVIMNMVRAEDGRLVTDSGQSYRIGNRTLTRADLGLIQAEIRRLLAAGATEEDEPTNTGYLRARRVLFRD